jgi:hypothetical protein
MGQGVVAIFNSNKESKVKAPGANPEDTEVSVKVYI